MFGANPSDVNTVENIFKATAIYAEYFVFRNPVLR